MKQLRVTTPFLDSTCSNQKRNVGDVYLCKEERAALLVRNGFCEYVYDETTKREHKNTDNGNTDKGDFIVPEEVEKLKDSISEHVLSVYGREALLKMEPRQLCDIHLELLAKSKTQYEAKGDTAAVDQVSQYEETCRKELMESIESKTDNDGNPDGNEQATDGNANETESDVNGETDKSDTKTEKKTTTKKGIKK